MVIPGPFLPCADQMRSSQSAHDLPGTHVPSLLEVHPDFSIPSNYCSTYTETLGVEPTSGPSIFATAAAQEYQSEETSSTSSNDVSTWQERQEVVHRVHHESQVQIPNVSAAIQKRCGPRVWVF